MIYDVIIIGGGHAGVEAASAAERMGGKVLLITMNIDSIAQLACNPSIGGIGKSQIVKEIDALGGLMGKAANYSGIHFRTLNSSKGYAVRSTRIQVDKNQYKKYILTQLIKQKNLFIIQNEVIDIQNINNIIHVYVKNNEIFLTKSIILTLGTFLKGEIHIGKDNILGGRIGENASLSLKNFFSINNIVTKRFKTGTPPRLDIRTINFSKLDKQISENQSLGLSFFKKINKNIHVDCFITYTNEYTHKLIKNNIKLSHIYSVNTPKSLGTRYCPSIEDKIMKYQKDKHLIFLQLESYNNLEIYPNGLSNCFPYKFQTQFIQSIKGLENVFITRPGYAIEYDYIDSTELNINLQHKKLNFLFFAGQINGTTGYEEAAAQGLIAGINAYLYSKNLKSWTPKRNEAYIGVLLEDLTKIGITEPYRMFTSRSEYRLNLREDNADYRLSYIAFKLKLINKNKYYIFKQRQKRIKQEIEKLKITKYQGKRIYDLIKENKTYNDLIKEKIILNNKILTDIDKIFIESTIKYEGYIIKEQNNILKLKKNYILPKDINIDKIDSLSYEIKEKISKNKIIDLEKIKKIPGITPAGIIAILNYIKKNYDKNE